LAFYLYDDEFSLIKGIFSFFSFYKLVEKKESYRKIFLSSC
jgi:hypothetical protein